MASPRHSLDAIAGMCRRHAVLILSCLGVVVYGLATGPDLNFDLRNIRAYNAWMIVRGRLGDDALSNLLTQYLPIHDVINVILLGTGKWWLPVAFWAALHGSIVIVAYRIAGLLAPNAPQFWKQLIAASSLASPLIMMEIGTSFGDLTAAPFFGLTLLVVLRRKDHWNWFAAGTYLAIAAVAKPTMLLTAPPIFFGVTLLGYSLVQVATFGIAFVGVYFSAALVWAAYWTHESGVSWYSIPGLPLSGLKFVMVTVFAVGLLVTGLLPQMRGVISRLDTSLARRRYMWIARGTALLFVVRQGISWHRQFTYSGSSTSGALSAVDWMVFGWSDFFRRLYHTGSLRDGFRLIDLEIPYRDVRVPFAVVTLVVTSFVAIGHLALGRFDRFRSTFGAVVTVVAPILFVIWILGYARYFIQFIPFVPVAAFAALTSVRSYKSRQPRTASTIIIPLVVLVFAVLAVIPLQGGTLHVRKFAQTESKGSLLSASETKMLNAFIPKDTTVHLAGILISSAAVVLNRPDVKWTYSPPSSVERQRRNHIVLYSPQWQKQLISWREAGVRTQNCVVLRFRYAIYGVCDLAE